jgi:hypothetical protein
MTYVLADPTLAHRSAGEEFARVVAGAPTGEVAVPLAVSLPATFPLAAHRPRYTVRHLLKTATVPDAPARYVSEARGPSDTAGVSYAQTPEAAFRPSLTEAELTDLRATVPLPAGMSADPALLAAFVDHRVVVRLCTVENETLLRGSADKAITGLLGLADLRRRRAPGPLADEIATAAADVEEMGGSCDAIVTHPRRYWQMVLDGTLARLDEIGVRVSRTRMIGPDEMLFGDFRAAVTLLETGTSTLRLHRGDDGESVSAEIRLGLAVHLPQHFLLLDLG